MLNEMEKLSSELRNAEKNRKVMGQALREELKQSIQKCKKIELTCAISAVDGGIIGKELHGIDLTITKACSATFFYENNSIKNTSYFPSAFPNPKLEIASALEPDEFNFFKGVSRLEEEIGCAIATLKEKNPKVLILDGSILPSIQDKPPKGSRFRERFENVLKLYSELFAEAEKRKTSIVAIVKDSRGKHWIEETTEKMKERWESRKNDLETIAKSTDSTILNYVLNEGEKTAAIKYTKNFLEHRIARHFRKEIADKMKIFYIKPVENDHPLRVEFLDAGNEEEIANLAFTLSSINKSYAYPAILIEADLRAAVREEEAAQLVQQLKSKLFDCNIEMRKHTRPFR